MCVCVYAYKYIQTHTQSSKKSLLLPKESWKIIFLGSLDTLDTLDWHEAGLRPASYAAQQVMALEKELNRERELLGS